MIFLIQDSHNRQQTDLRETPNTILLAEHAFGI
jgi:hypothetical protein